MSPSTVWSTLFLSDAGLVGDSYEVPAGRVAVIRDVMSGVSGTTASGGFTYGVDELGGPVFLLAIPAGTSNEAYQWTGNQVLNPGDVLTVGTDITDATVSVRISGYLLQA